jgi:hypothetical protein
MLDDLTHEEWQGHLRAFRQDPWDEQRKDDRNAVNCMWTVGPHINNEDLELPGFNGPTYENKAQDTSESWKRLQEMKRKIQSGELNRKTSNPADH